MSDFSINIAFLTRALLNSRIGFEKSDNLVYYLTGLFAAIWSLAGMATWFLLLPKYTVCAFFDMTTGSIYAHVSSLFFWNPSLSTGMAFLDDI